MGPARADRRHDVTKGYPETAGPGVRRMAVRLPTDRPVAPGERITLAVDPAQLHWFDATGYALDPGAR